MVRKNFQSNGVQITAKCIYKSKKLKVDIFTHAPPQAKFFTRFLSSLPRQREIAHPPGSIFLKNLSPPSRKRGERKLCCRYNKEDVTKNQKAFILMEKMMIGYFFLLQKMLLKCCWIMFTKFFPELQIVVN